MSKIIALTMFSVARAPVQSIPDAASPDLPPTEPGPVALSTMVPRLDSALVVAQWFSDSMLLRLAFGQRASAAPSNRLAVERFRRPGITSVGAYQR